MIQMHGGKTMLTKNKVLASLPPMNHFQFVILAHVLHLLLLITFGGFKILQVCEHPM